MEPADNIKLINKEILATTGIHNAYEKSCGAFTLEQLFTPDTVRLSALRCACGFRNRNDTMVFLDSIDANSKLLCERVLDGRFYPRYYRERAIIERGKPRIIKPPVFESKVVQKLVCDYLVRPLLEPKMISTSYAGIKGRGTEMAYQDVLRALNHAARTNPNAVVVMTDYKNYFGSIPIDTLFGILGRYVRDTRVLSLMRSFSPGPYGLSLGNELSQVPASWYPSPVDHHMKDRLARAYFRYMDDTLWVAPDIAHAEADLDAVRSMSDSLGLVIPDQKVRVVPVGRSITWCKEQFRMDSHTGLYYRYMNPSRVSRERRVVSKLTEQVLAGAIDFDVLETQWKSVKGSWRARPNAGAGVAEIEDLVWWCGVMYRQAIEAEGRKRKQKTGR